MVKFEHLNHLSIFKISQKKDGKEFTRINGVDPVKLSEQVEKLASGAEVESEVEVKETLNEKLHRLIHQDSIVLFMKGTPKNPQCKFRLVVFIKYLEF